MVLRKFRDETLKSSFFGRLFIKLYYAVSPTVVKMLGNNKLFRDFWKALLDAFVRKVDNR